MNYALCTKLPPQSLRDSSPKLRRAITAYKLKATKSARFFDEKSKKS